MIHERSSSSLRASFGAFAFLFVAALASGCASPEESMTSPPAALAAPAASARPAPLPAVVGDCESEDRPAPTLCAWAGSADAIIVGVLRDLRLMGAPLALGSSDGFSAIDHCDGAVSPGVELSIEVQRALVGEPPSNIVVAIGADQARSFSPRPELAIDGSVQWEAIGTRSGEELRVGQVLGMALHKAGNPSVWSLLGEQLFAVERADGEDHLQVQPHYSSCSLDSPDLEPYATARDLEEAVKSCAPSPEADLRRRRLIDVSARRPDLVNAAVCVVAPHRLPARDQPE